MFIALTEEYVDLQVNREMIPGCKIILVPPKTTPELLAMSQL